MNISDLPTRFNYAFAYSASASYIRSIPDAHQAAGGSDAPASLYDGFPPECFSPIGSGGIPPNGKDFNGILNRITAWNRWQAAGGPAIYNSAFSTAIGGYPKGAMLASTVTNGKFWVSTANGNTTDPDGGSPANWLGITAGNTLTEQAGSVTGTITAGTTGFVTFPTPFASACTQVICTGVNLTGSSARDNWIQRGGLSASGFSYTVQGAVTGGDNTLDGFDWIAKGY